MKLYFNFIFKYIAQIPVFSRTQLSKVFCRPFQFKVMSFTQKKPCTADFGTISLNNSIFNLPAGVSPMLTSINTIGRVEEDICGEGTTVTM